MTKNVWLLVLFGCYLTGLPVFALIYSHLYRKRRSTFVFAGDIRDTRLADLKAEADNLIASLELLNTYFTAFISDRTRNAARVEDDITRFTAVLADGRHIVVEQHIEHLPPEGAESELLPWVELWRSDTTREWGGRVEGHGFLSEYTMIEEFVENAARGLESDVSTALQNRNDLENDSLRIWGFLDFLYFSTITQSTVGYGDILPNDTTVRFVVVCQIIFAYAVLIVGLNIILGSAPFTWEWFLN